MLQGQVAGSGGRRGRLQARALPGASAGRGAHRAAYVWLCTKADAALRAAQRRAGTAGGQALLAGRQRLRRAPFCQSSRPPSRACRATAARCCAAACPAACPAAGQGRRPLVQGRRTHAASPWRTSQAEVRNKRRTWREAVRSQAARAVAARSAGGPHGAHREMGVSAGDVGGGHPGGSGNVVNLQAAQGAARGIPSPARLTPHRPQAAEPKLALADTAVAQTHTSTAVQSCSRILPSNQTTRWHLRILVRSHQRLPATPQLVRRGGNLAWHSTGGPGPPPPTHPPAGAQHPPRTCRCTPPVLPPPPSPPPAVQPGRRR